MQKNEDELLSAKSMPPENPNPNPNPQNPNPKLREEGELTSSDDDALPALSGAPSTSMPAPSSSTVPNVPAKSYVQGSNLGKPIPANLPARAADKHRQTPGYTKGFSKNTVLLKPSNPGWQAPAGNANLVISFSDDDDSGSDEERRQKNAQAINRHALANSSQRPPALPHVKLDTAERTAKNEGNVTKKVALSRTFISSMTKIHGSTVKSTGALAQRRSWTKNSNVTGRILPSQDGKSSKHVDLSTTKLQDLRQQIAMRENELKLKVVQKSKESVSESCRDVNIVGQSKVSSKKSRTVFTDVQTDTEEPDVKRLKLAEYSYGQPSSRSHQNKFSVHVPPDANIPGHAHHETKVAEKELLPRSIEMQIEDGKQLPLPSHNKISRLVQDAPGVTVSCSLSDWVSRPMEALARPMHTASLTNANFGNHLEKSQHTGLLNKKRSSSSISNHDTCVNNMNKVNDHHAVMSIHEKLKSKSDSSLQPHSLQVSDSKFASPNASPDNTNVLHSLGKPTVSEYEVDSYFEMEELHDKELEEAQEHRRRCEVEERNALKAYRRAQRALVEANARCTRLYHKRELYSAQLRTILMEDSSLLLTSRQHRQIGDAWNLSYNVSEANLELMPTSSHQLQADCETGNQVGYGSNAQSADGDAHNRLYGNEDGNNLGSEACSEPDASTSELLVRGNRSAANDVCSPSNDQNLSPDDDGETSPMGHRSIHGSVTWPREDNNKESTKGRNVGTPRSLAVGSSQDPLVLEAYLRSKLFSRLGVTDSSKRNAIFYDCKSAAGVAEENVASARAQTVTENALSDPKGISSYCGESFREPEGSISEPTLDKENQQPTEEHAVNESHTLAFDSEDDMFHSKDIAATSIISASSIFKSAMMSACPSKLNEMQIIEKHHDSSGMCVENDMLTGQSEKSSLEKAVKYVSFGKFDSYTFKAAIDPFKPLCMYELRGRCNNDECPWQHLKDVSSRNVNKHDSSDGADCTPASSSDIQIQQRGCMESSGVLIPPRYLVCFDGLKADTHTDGSLVARHIGASRKNIFSISLAVSNLLIKQLPSDEPYLHGNDGCVDSFVGSGHSLYFRSRNGAGNPLRNGLADNDQALEIALLVLNQEVNRLDGLKQALALLSRALEAEPASYQMWIVYLLLFYSTKNSVGELSKRSSVEVDFFSHAVKHNAQSYELWLLYINSRSQLNDRVAAYKTALSSLCCHASTNDGHGVHNSAVILDLFLQQLYCLCISGNISEADRRIEGLILTDKDPDESHSLLLSDILQCLTISDKCIFWVCCVYLVIYRKLPDALVRQFEFEKDISVVEWPYVRLTLEGKERVLKLMKMALDSVSLRLDGESYESSNLKSAFLIALNHIKFMVAIDGEESGKMLLEKYRNSYPSCLQLTLLSARAKGSEDESKKLEGFEEALSNWPKDVPGIQSIWNQFAEYALENGRPDRAKDIMDKWFQDGSIDFGNDDPSSGPSDNTDTVFGLLNLSLFRLFQNDVLSAQLAIDKALRTADNTELLRHCIREHAAFLFNNRSQLKKDTSLHGLLDILKGYMIHAQPIAFPGLTTKFIKDIKKPRLRQLVSNILCPTSPDSSLVNLVLDAWFGSSLLPQNTDDLKNFVDFVESLLAVSPGNYQVAISICKLICKDPDVGKSESASVFFWASSLLVNTIYSAIPVPPEFVWVEGADLLRKLTDKQEIVESFHQRALSMHPFSIKLWNSFLDLSITPSKRSNVIEAARDKGIELGHDRKSWNSS